MPMKIFITGGSGFIGTRLTLFLLDQGYRIIATGTSAAPRSISHHNYRYIPADTTKPGAWQDQLEDIDAAVNLAGRNIFKPWSESYKKQIYDSRILTTRNLVEALPDNREIILCTTSAAGYYGDRGDEVLLEDASPGDDFLAKVCQDWEKEAFEAGTKGIRVAAMRFSVVLGKNGGALAKMLPTFKFFVGGPLGSGLQWFPWIHLDDLMAAVVFILEDRNINGPLNFCAPGTVRHRDFAKALGSALNRPSFMKAPGFMIRLIMGELGAALLSSQRVLPDKLLKRGFEFQYPDIDHALRDLIL